MEKRERKASRLIQQRYVVAGIGFLAFFICQSLCLNDTIVMVAMVNSTSTKRGGSYLNKTECPSGFNNSSDGIPLRGEFSWSPQLQGYILGATFLGNGISQAPSGVLAKKYGAKKVLLSGLVLSSACNLLSPLGARYHAYLLLALYFVKGYSIGLLPPAVQVSMSRWFSSRERGAFGAVMHCGVSVGAFLAGSVGGLLCDLEFLNGWPLTFYGNGLFSLFVAGLTLFFFFDEPERNPRISQEELEYIQGNKEAELFTNEPPPTPWVAILTSVPAYSLYISKFGALWMNIYLVSVNEIYIGTVLNLPMRQSGVLTGGPFAVMTITSLLTSYASFWIGQHTNWSVNAVRKGFNSLGCIGFSLGLLGVYFSKCDIFLYGLFLYIATASTSFLFLGCYITPVDMSPAYCGPLSGISNFVAFISGFILPLVVGRLTNEEQSLAQWGKIFFITIGISLVCGMIFLVFGSAKLQPWDPAFAKCMETKKEKSTEFTESTTTICSTL